MQNVGTVLCCLTCLVHLATPHSPLNPLRRRHILCPVLLLVLRVNQHRPHPIPELLYEDTELEHVVFTLVPLQGVQGASLDEDLNIVRSVTRDCPNSTQRTRRGLLLEELLQEQEEQELSLWLALEGMSRKELRRLLQEEVRRT